MTKITRLAIGVLGTGGGILAAGLFLAVGSMLLEGGQQSLGIGLIMLSLYIMLLVHAFIITSRIRDILEEIREEKAH
jgi:1,4-dihydroxy-2-naphthoate octaprenyltransferase